MRLSPWLRFFNGWHRRVLSAHCPALASLPTTEGYSTSSALRHVALDILGYSRTQIRRVVKKAAQRLTGRPVLDRLGATTVNDPMLLPRVRASRAFAEALGQLKTTDLLAQDLPASARTPCGPPAHGGPVPAGARADGMTWPRRRGQAAGRRLSLPAYLASGPTSRRRELHRLRQRAPVGSGAGLSGLFDDVLVPGDAVALGAISTSPSCW